MYILMCFPMKSMRSTCVYLRPKFSPKDSLKSFYRAADHRRKSYAPFLLPPYPNHTWVITGCSALHWMVTVPRGAAGQPGIAIAQHVPLSPSSTLSHFCSPLILAKKCKINAAQLHMPSTDDIRKHATYFSGRVDGTSQWPSMASQKEIRYLHTFAMQSYVQIIWKCWRQKVKWIHDLTSGEKLTGFKH